MHSQDDLFHVSYAILCDGGAGETFEWVHEGHYRIVLEQVCNNPSISAWHVESLLKERKYTMYGEMEFRNKFWGKTADLIPVGR